MDSKIKYILGGVAFLSVGAILLLQGCSQQIPPLSAVIVPNPGAAALPTDYVNNFENGSLNVNLNLLGYPSGNSSSVTELVPNGSSSGGGSSFTPGFWSVNTYGGPGSSPNTINHPFLVPNAVSDATDSSGYAIHIGWPSAPVTCIAVGGYEADQLTCSLGGSNTYYDATPFTGVAFYYNILPDDTTTYRQFEVSTINTVSAFNHFHFLMPNGSSSGWKAVTVTWSQLVYPGFGPNSGLITTPGPTGNLNHFVGLQWAWSDNAQGSIASPVTNLSDFWVDNVQFLP
jgi:hypothetical protein